MNKFFYILLKLATIVVLVVAATTKQHYNYYTFVHWYIFATSIYLAVKSRENGIFTIVLFSAFAILFNPFREFIFSKHIWGIIDLIVSALILLTIDWKGYKESLSPERKLIYNLSKQCIYGVAALIASIWFVSYSIKVNPYYEYQLITKSKIANGFITKVEEHKDEIDIPDAQGGGSEMVTVDSYDYNFTTQDGKVINARSSDLGYMPNFKNEPLPIRVEYLPYNPRINRVKDETSECKTLGEFIWKRLGLGGLLIVVFCSIGFVMIRNGIKEFVTERKKLTANFQEHGFAQSEGLRR